MPLKKCRKLSGIPSVKGFKPLALPMDLDNAIILELDEHEALKLMDYDGMIHEEASKAMNVSRPTLSRIYDNARKKVAKAFVEGKTILIQGGAVELEQEAYRCSTCGFHFDDDSSVDQINPKCPQCQSKEVVHVLQCFYKGCGCCKKCLY